MNLPNGWKTTTIGDFAPFIYGKPLPEHSRSADGEYPVYGSNGIVGVHDEPHVQGAGIVIGRKGSVGNVHLSKNGFWPIDTTFYVADDANRDLEFTFYLLLNLNLGRFVSDNTIPGLNRNTAHEVNIRIPPLPEQREIARILSLWDDALRDVAALIAAKTRLKRALMQQLLGGKRRFAEFDEPWVTVAIGDALEEVNRFVDWDDEANYRLVSVRRRSGGLFFRQELDGHEILTKVMKTTRAGDFTIARMQAVHGAFAMTPPDFDGYNVSGSYTTLVARPGIELWMPFLDYLSHSPSFYYSVMRSAYGVSIEKMTFNTAWFLEEKISLPPTIEEQRRIAEVLDGATREIELLQRQRAALARQKRGLMARLLSGQTRVKTAD